MARKRHDRTAAWARRKMSATILAFGAPLIDPLPGEAPLELRRALLDLVVQIWNAHVMAMPQWGQPHFLVQMRQTLERNCQAGELQWEALHAFEILSHERARARFASDPRAVEQSSVQMVDPAHWSFSCDARLPASMNPDASGRPSPRSA